MDKPDQQRNDVIAPVDFTPVHSADQKQARKMSPAIILLVSALLLSALVLWFVLTARSLIVEVDPGNAEVQLSGLAFPLAESFLLRPGQYQVSVSAEGYYPATQQIVISDADSQILRLALDKLPGHLQLSSRPESTEILLDGGLVGITPITLKELAVGEHRLILRKQRYQEYSATINIEGLDKTQQLEVQLEPAWGTLEIDSNPQGANVLVAGEQRGVTPLSTELLSSGETVTVKLAGYKQWQQQLSVAAGKTLQIPLIELTPADGLLQLDSQPRGAGITVNGVYQGITPAELQLKPGQPHQIRLFLDGYQTVERQVNLETGAERSIVEKLAAQSGSLRIVPNPKDADIYIDGRLIGRSAQTVSLPAKAHRLEVRRAGYVTKAQTVTPRPGIEQVVQVSLLTEQQAYRASLPAAITTVTGQQLKLFHPQQDFTLGASRREAGRRSNEVLREVRLERPFYLATTTITNKQYKQFKREHSSSHTGGVTLDTPNQPVVRVSWNQAALFCNWLSEQQKLPHFYKVKEGVVVGIDTTSTGYRLPTEAEWAWAARYNSGAMLKYPWGDNYPPASVSGNYADKSGSKILGKVLAGYDDRFVASAPVASFAANGKGLYDLGNNVSEWIHDFYGVELGLSLKRETDPLGPDKGEYRVLRGASWRDSDITELRLSYRDYGLDARDDIGFRIARYAE